MSKRTVTLTLAGLLLAGCSSVIAAVGVFVRVGPPRPVVERIAPSPGPRYVWAAGYYRWSGRAYVWVPGAWVYPPRPAAVWVAPRWDFVPGRGGYVFVPGYWR